MIQTVDLIVRAGQFVLSGVNLRIPGGAYSVLMGKTGSGKTTLLEAICGLKQIDGGKILIDGRDVTHHKPAERGIGFVPQEGALFQTMTVRRHLDFALRVRRWPAADVRARVQQLAEMLEIDHLLDRRPDGLSGGERQRVALGRALSFRPGILCLDEPLSALDEETHDHLVGLLQRIRQETGVTALHVTHNRREAEALADCRLQIVDGQVHRVQPPDSTVADVRVFDGPRSAAGP